ncbi:hypothetical protein MLD38_013052 [Melastoma candidum]|uniref:Uncharacterized protein n=1 Tax=Melastoma candidum TaxID=119954 RepID=A0ACB9R8A5_9MYRT|nr:hypothetical protein MLD38_013052 [Melastoma candidum]
MGRGKIEIRRIENSNNRQVTYSKRRNGLIKKAKEIAVLCDAKVSVVILGSSGKMHDFCCPPNSLVNILDQYHTQSGKRLWEARHESLSGEVDRMKKENDNLQIKLRHLKGQDIASLNYRELMILEDGLENGLTCIRNQKDELMKTYRRNQKLLEEENRELHFHLQQRDAVMAESMRMAGAGSGEGGGDYNSQLPFAFRVQPIQPNMQERI